MPKTKKASRPKGFIDTGAKVEAPIWSIDKNNLDAECILHPKMVSRYAGKLPDARAELDRAESNLKVVAAEEDAKIRESPKDYGLEKVTEAAIKSKVPSTRLYQKAEKEVREAKHYLDTLQVALDVLRAKKSSLEFLVQLHGMSYFSSVKTKLPNNG